MWPLFPVVITATDDTVMVNRIADMVMDRCMVDTAVLGMVFDQDMEGMAMDRFMVDMDTEDLAMAPHILVLAMDADMVWVHYMEDMATVHCTAVMGMDGGMPVMDTHSLVTDTGTACMDTDIDTENIHTITTSVKTACVLH